MRGVDLAGGAGVKGSTDKRGGRETKGTGWDADKMSEDLPWVQFKGVSKIL